MAWTTPITYVAGNPLTAAQLNVMQANLNALKRPPAARYDNKNYMVGLSSTSLVELDTTNLTLNVTLAAVSRLLIVFRASVVLPSGTNVITYFDPRIDGVTIGDGVGPGGLFLPFGGYEFLYSITHVTADTVAAGAHQLKIYAKTTSPVTVYTVSAYIQEF